MTEYVATPNFVNYYSGATGDPDVISGTFPTYTSSVTVTWTGDFTADQIVGFKIVFDASAGDGYMYWDWEADNPGWPTTDNWPAEDFVSHIGWNNSYAGAASAIRVNGPTHYEHKFFWPGDPTFGGYVYNDPLSDLLISLNQPAASHSVNANLGIGEGAPAVPIVVTRFDLVLFTAAGAPPLRRYPRAGVSGPSRMTKGRLTRRPGTY